MTADLPDLATAALRWVIGRMPAEDLVDNATEALLRGEDSPSLRLLAGLHRDDYWEIKQAFENTLDELGIPLRDEQEALWQLARHIARSIVDGDIAPLAGAAQIWAEISHRIMLEGDFRIFIRVGLGVRGPSRGPATPGGRDDQSCEGTASARSATPLDPRSSSTGRGPLG